jgi:hypothetical protein
VRLFVGFLSVAGFALLIVCGDSILASGQTRNPARFQSALDSDSGLLLNTVADGALRPWCSVSLVDTDLVLTAYHCVTSTHARDVLSVFFPYEGIRKVRDSGIQPYCPSAYRSNDPGGSYSCSPVVDDLVLLQLTAPYTLLKPLDLAASFNSAEGLSARVSGFGIRSGNLHAYGIRRSGKTVIERCDASRGAAKTSLPENIHELCFDFDPGGEAITGIGPYDSGGPMFLDDREAASGELIGVAVGVVPAASHTGSWLTARYLNLAYPPYRSWLVEKLSERKYKPGRSAIEVLLDVSTAFLQPGVEDRFPLEIHDRPHRLIITLNHSPGPAMFPYDLRLNFSPGLHAKCQRYTTLEVCQVDSPRAGTLEVGVGHGGVCNDENMCGDEIYPTAYQLTAVAVYDPRSMQAGQGAY